MGNHKHEWIELQGGTKRCHCGAKRIEHAPESDVERAFRARCQRALELTIRGNQ